MLQDVGKCNKAAEGHLCLFGIVVMMQLLVTAVQSKHR